METVHHVHADDVAQVFMQAIFNRATSLGEAFNAVSPAALTLKGYAEAMAAWFGKEPNLKFLPFEEWKSAAEARGRRRDLGAHLSQPLPFHRKGEAADQLRAALHLAAGRAGSGHLADRDGEVKVG